MSVPLIEFRKVCKQFGEQVILKDADLRIYKGEVTTVIGKSGVGKSVLLKHIIGLMAPDSGEVLFNGHPLSSMTRQGRKDLKRKFSYMFQGTALFDSMTVFENIALPLKERSSLREHEIYEPVIQMMENLDLAGIEEKYPSQLSGGMKKRVALARALITEPETVLFDEPTTGLDPIRKNAVHSMISDYQKRFGFTGIVVSHEIPDVFYISQRVAMLEKGQIVFQGSPDEIQAVSDETIREFVQGLEAGRDTLTGMIPQTQGERRFYEEMSRLQRYQTAFSVLLFSLENLDEVNEATNHAVGQRLLQDFSRALQSRLRASDVCCRYGLNKIISLLPNTNEYRARLACEKLAVELRLADVTELRPYRGFHLQISAGFAEAHRDNPLEDILIRAESKRNRVCDFRIERQDSREEA
jgi:phospholipid/cholesterol/gamma-HCH transport system ATP-binding protein